MNCRSCSPSPEKQGRPPIGETPMTPNTLSERKRDLGKSAYMKDRTSRKLSESVASRWSLKIRFHASDNDTSIDSEHSELCQNLSDVSSSESHIYKIYDTSLGEN